MTYLLTILTVMFLGNTINSDDFIQKQEGYIPYAKDIGNGKITSGFGLTNTGRNSGYYVPYEQAIKEFTKRLNMVERPALRKIQATLPFKLTKYQETVILSLLFNVGVNEFNNSQALKYLQASNVDGFKYEEFSRERGYVHIKGTFSKGLYNRRQRELKLWDRK